MVAIALVALVVVVGLLATGGGSRRSGPPLSPRSDTDGGTSALVEVLSRLGARPDVVVGAPSGAYDSVLVLRDVLTDAERAKVTLLAEQGATVVVADAGSPLRADRGSTRSVGTTIGRGACDLDGIDGVQGIATGAASGGSVAVDRLVVPEGATSCFDGYVVRRPVGRGAIVSIGGTQPFVNRLLATGDGSTLAVDLLAPTDRERVAVLDVVRAPGDGQETLGDLVAPRVRGGLALLVVAFVVYALHRGRRLGAPVGEHQPVAIAGSGLVRAVGRLQQRSGRPDRAASVLRAELQRQLVRRYGLPAGSPAATVASVVAARTGLDAARVAAALGGAPVTDDASLVALVAELDVISREVSHVSR